MLSKELAFLIRRSQNVLFFTGAGVSTGSGIPDFRGPEGLWNRMRPVYFNEFMTSHEARVRHWKYKLDSWATFCNAKPSQGHRAIYELDRMGCLDTLVTQNIDGLHQLAGHSEERLIELHGTNRKIVCISCQAGFEPDLLLDQFAKDGNPPLCQCGGFLKSGTISFGQAMPQAKLEAAFTEASCADLVVSVGSTLEVEPAASVPQSAKDNGAMYVIINQGATAHDKLADFRIEDDINTFLPSTVNDLQLLL